MWSTIAVILYLLPLFGFVVLRRLSPDGAFGRAFDVPLAVGGDLLLILLTSRFVVLDYAVLGVRSLELASLVFLFVRRRSELRLPPWSTWPRIFKGSPLWGALLAVGISRTLSVTCAIWDRHWHMPLVASMRGQLAPFENVYEPGTRFFYHYAGNALAAIFQSLSLAHLHASAALSRAHDVMFGVIGLFVAMALRAFGVRRAALGVLGVFLMLTAGPATILFEGLQRWGTGRSLSNSLSLSFRPHEPLSFLFSSALLLAGLGPLLSSAPGTLKSARWAVPVFAAVLTLSDEPTLALVLGCLGVAWLCAPGHVAGSWRDRAAFLLAPVAALLITVWLLGGTFSPGAPKQALELVRPRVPGFYLPSLPLRMDGAVSALITDYLGPLGVALAGGVAVWHAPSSRSSLLLLAQLALLVASLLVLVAVKVNRDDIESHRAVTGLLVFAPLFLLLWFARLPQGEARAWVLGIGGVACMLGSASTVEWVRGVAEPEAERLKPYWGDDMFYDTDCVAATGARLGERPMPSVGPRDGWYLFAGCRPLFVPSGGMPGGHAIAVGWPDVEASVLGKVRAWLPRFERVRVFAPRGAESVAPVPAEMLKLPTCRPAGQKFVECVESSARFERLLGTR